MNKRVIQLEEELQAAKNTIADLEKQLASVDQETETGPMIDKEDLASGSDLDAQN